MPSNSSSLSTPIDVEHGSIAIQVVNLTKSYRLFSHPGERIKQFFSFGLKKYHRTFTALENISFDIKKGETVGIIGHNGSGKSTLLQVICGILKPTTGTVLTHGRICALLELGAGFNPEFTGRENIYFYGALMGFSKTQMDQRFSEIEAFAEIGEFIDQPVRMYSSGMFVRLAFSAAIHSDPDILVVDEALAVGDTKFQGRCFDKIQTIRNRGGTILVVTHALEQVAHFCDRALLLNQGRLLAYGETTSTLSRYMATMHQPRELKSPHTLGTTAGDLFCKHPTYNPDESRWGDRAASITEVLITQNDIENPANIVPGSIVELKIKIVFHSTVKNPIYGLAIKSPAGALLLSTNSKELLGPNKPPDQIAGSSAFISFFFTPFLECGRYLLSFGIVSESISGLIPHDRRYDAISIQVSYPKSATGDVAFNPYFHLATT